jgi:hypothetical protein
MSQYVFGTGQLFATPVGGGAPLRFGALQDVSVDFSGDIKQLFGQYQFALDVARGKTKVEWKASTGNVDVNAFNQIFFGQTVTTGDELLQAINEAWNHSGDAVPAHRDPWRELRHGPRRLQCDNGSAAEAGCFGSGDGSVFGQRGGRLHLRCGGHYAGRLLNYLWDSASTGGSLICQQSADGQRRRSSSSFCRSSTKARPSRCCSTAMWPTS